jgi:hypothetical protein
MLYNYYIIGLLPIDNDCHHLIKQLFCNVNVKVVTGPPIDYIKHIQGNYFTYEDDIYEVTLRKFVSVSNENKKIILNNRLLYCFKNTYICYTLSLCINHKYIERHDDTLWYYL